LKKYFSSYWIRSAFYTFLQRFSITFFGFINFVILIRTFTPAQMGSWALFLTVTSIFESTKSGLLKNAHIRYVTASEEPDERTGIASSSFIINASISLLFILLIAFFSDWLGSWLHAGKDLASMLKSFIPGLIFMILFSHFEAVQQSHLDFKGVFAGYFIRQFLFFLIILLHLVFHIPFTLVQLALYQSLCVFIGTITIYFYSRKYLLYRFNASAERIKKILGYGGYIFGSGFMSNIFASRDQIMISKFITSSSVAYYNAAARINSLVDIPSYAAAEILFPKASQASVEKGREKVKYLYERMVSILMSFTTPAALFIILFPHLIIVAIAGSKYAAAAPILQLYMITGILRPMQNQAANILNSIGRPGLCFAVNTISLAANLVINYFCILNFGFYGAAIGTLITCLLGSVTWYFIMRRQINLELMNVVRYSAGVYKMLYEKALGLFKKKEAPATTLPIE